jgi:anti-sigma B factor antagonist
MKAEVKDALLVIYLDENMLQYSEVDETMEWLKGYFKTGIKEVVINMKGVAFLNSAGLGKLVQWGRKYKIAGGKMVFCNVSQHTQKLLKLTKLEDAFNILPEEESAIAYLKDLRPRR